MKTLAQVVAIATGIACILAMLMPMPIILHTTDYRNEN